MSSKIIAGTTSSTALNMSADTSGILEIQTGSTPTTAITVDTAQNVGIGTSSPNIYSTSDATNILGIQASGTNKNGLIAVASTGSGYGGIEFGNATIRRSGIYTLDGSALSFYTNGSNSGTSLSERMRINSNGTVGVGTTGGTFQLDVRKANGTNAILNIENQSNSNGDVATYFSLGTNANNTNSYYLICNTPAVANRMFIYGNGNIVNANNSYGVLSDVKLKENIVDASSKLDDVMKLQVRNYNLKTDPEHKQIGFIAQELEQVFPSMIDESNDLDENNNLLETTTKSIKTSVLVPILVKAIQELNAKVDAQAAEIKALKGVA